MNKDRPTFRIVASFAVLFVIGDVFLATMFAYSLPSAMPMLWILIILVVFALIILSAKAIWWSLPRRVRRTLQDL